jgi:hypothetical protein
MDICLKCLQTIEDQSPVHGLHGDCFCSWFRLDVTGITDFSDVALRSEKLDSSLLSNPINTTFFQGTFKKYSANLNGCSYILKVQDQDYPELPRTEYLSNQIARRLGLIVPDFYMINFLNELDTFVTHNFMDNHTPGNLIHIYHFIKNEQPFSCKTILKIIEEKIGRIESIKQFVFLCLFDSLIGNHDRHGRNIALIETKKGFQLAPFYDNPSYIGIEDNSLLLAQHNPKGKIATSLTNQPTMQDYIVEFHKMGFGELLREFRKKIDNTSIRQMIDRSFLSEKRKTAFSLLIDRRVKEFDDAKLF